MVLQITHCDMLADLLGFDTAYPACSHELLDVK